MHGVDRFTITSNRDLRLVRVAMYGFWGLDDVATYRSEVASVARQMEGAGCPLSEMLVLVDTRELPTQSQSVIDAYKAVFDSDDVAVRRLATIVSSALFKMQVKRIGISNQELFDDESGAVAWLLSGVRG